MADKVKPPVSFHIGKKSVIEKKPLKKGQFMIGTISDETAAIYVDTKDDKGNVIRVVLDIESLISRISELEETVELLQQGIEEGLIPTSLHTSDGSTLVTNSNEKIIVTDNT